MEPFSYMSAANPEITGEADVHVLFAGESQTGPSHRLGPKIYDYYLFHFIEQGCGVFKTENATYHLEGGSGFLIQPNQLVSYESDAEKPWRYRWAAFSGPAAVKLAAQAGFSLDNPVIHADSGNPIPEYLESILGLFRQQREGAELAATGYLHLILAEVKHSLLSGTDSSGNEGSGQRMVKQMIQYMSSQYAYPISIEEMGVALGYNRAYLSRLFKKGTGMTPVTYLLKLRIDKARHLLRDRPDLSIEQIAQSVGLTDPLYFSRQFKRFYGQAPSVYRQDVTGGLSKSRP